MPIHTAPWTWPSTASGLIAKPQSCATQTRRTVDRSGILVDADLDDLRCVREPGRRADGRAAELAALRFRRRRPRSLDDQRSTVHQRSIHSGGKIETAIGARNTAVLTFPLDVIGVDLETFRRSGHEQTLHLLRCAQRCVADHERHA